MKTVFISRYLDPASPLKKGLEKAGCKVIGESLLHIAGIRYPGVPACDWIFFSGKNAIRYLLSDTPVLPSDVKFAVKGRGSQLALRKFGFEADFVGKGNDASKIGRSFSQLITNEKVLFVTALDSPLTIQSQLPLTCSWKNLYVYKNELKREFSIPPADILVFTSPNNAAAYFSRYSLVAGQEVVAIGTTTMKELLRHGVHKVILPEEFYERKLLSTILDLVRGGSTLTGKRNHNIIEEQERAA